MQSFLFEILIKPLRLGVKMIKIPGAWRANFGTFARDFEYFGIGLGMPFVTGRNILRQALI